MQTAEEELKALMMGGLEGDAAAHATLLHALVPLLRSFYRRRLHNAAENVEDGTIATLLVIGLLGLRADLSSAVQAFPFWMKWSYTLSMGVGALFAVGQLAQPTPTSLRKLWILAIPALLLAAVSLVEFANTPTRNAGCSSRRGFIRSWFDRFDSTAA